MKSLSLVLSTACGIPEVIEASWRIHGSSWQKALVQARVCREFCSSQQVLLYSFWRLAKSLAKSLTLSCACQKRCTSAHKVLSHSCWMAKLTMGVNVSPGKKVYASLCINTHQEYGSSLALSGREWLGQLRPHDRRSLG
jgi:hypothetical protein